MLGLFIFRHYDYNFIRRYLIYTSRSQYVDGMDCQTKRYYRYHVNKSGIVGNKLALPLWTGTVVHKGLEILFKEASRLSRMPSRDEIRPFLDEAIGSLVLEASKGFNSEEDDDGNIYIPQDFTLQEQLALAKGLIWGYYRAILPKILEEYEVIRIEEEFPIDIKGLDTTGDLVDIHFQTRPDLILRRKADGRLFLVDYKTSGWKVSKSTVNEYRVSPQMSSYCLAAERNLGEKISGYFIHSLLKGGRKAFTKKGQNPTQVRQYSSFCYAKINPANPPLQEASYDLGGYWYDKRPVWESYDAEEWVYMLSEQELYEHFTIIGPYDSSEFLGNQFLKSLEGEELEWDRKLQLLASGVDQDKIISRSYKCFDFGSQCSYYDICFLGSSPDGDKWTQRVPHHKSELEALREKI